MTSWAVAHPPPLCTGFPRRECWSGLPFPSPGDLPDPGIEPGSLHAAALAGRFFTTAPPGKPVLARWSEPKAGQSLSQSVERWCSGQPSPHLCLGVVRSGLQAACLLCMWVCRRNDLKNGLFSMASFFSTHLLGRCKEKWQLQDGVWLTDLFYLTCRGLNPGGGG